ncbi:hypothetical protein HQ520_12750, partial [bacterium]|nr:hypothetical protein [bacterium]
MRWTLDGANQTYGVATLAVTVEQDATAQAVYVSSTARYYLLDAYGTVHPSTPDLPQFSGGPYWFGWDIARALAIVPDGEGSVKGYYVLDGWGGVHPVGDVSAFAGGPFWAGWDIARGLAVVA